MENTAGSKCELCNAPLILLTQVGDEVVIEVDCPICLKEHHILMDDVAKEIPHKCCEVSLLSQRFDELCDLVLTVMCAKCGKPGVISLEDGFEALEITYDSDAPGKILIVH